MEPQARQDEANGHPERRGTMMFYGGAFWFCCIVFTADMIIPTGVAVGLGYVLPVAVGLMAPSPTYLKIVTPVCTLLILLGFFVSPIDGATWVAVTNRGLSMVILWVVAWLCFKLIVKNQRAASTP